MNFMFEFKSRFKFYFGTQNSSQFLCRHQCDQISEQKSSPIFFPKAVQILATAKSDVIQNSRKGHQIFWLLLQENLSPRNVKNRPIWSHWTRLTCFSSTSLPYSRYWRESHVTVVTMVPISVTRKIAKFAKK